MRERIEAMHRTDYSARPDCMRKRLAMFELPLDAPVETGLNVLNRQGFKRILSSEGNLRFGRAIKARADVGFAELIAGDTGQFRNEEGKTDTLISDGCQGFKEVEAWIVAAVDGNRGTFEQQLSDTVPLLVCSTAVVDAKKAVALPTASDLTDQTFIMR